MTLDLYQNFILAQYLENIWIEFHQKKNYIGNVWVGIITVISPIFNQVMALV